MRIIREISLDVLQCSDRFDIDAAEFSSPQLRSLVVDNYGRIPLRFLNVHIDASELSATFGHYSQNDANRRVFPGRLSDNLELLVKLTRHAYVAEFEVGSEHYETLLLLKQEFCEATKEMAKTAHIGRCSFRKATFAALNMDQFCEIFSVFSRIREIRFQECSLLRPHLTDYFLRQCAAKNVREVTWGSSNVPKDANLFAITDEGVIAFCKRRPVRNLAPFLCRPAGWGQRSITLCAHSLELSPNFFQRVVQARRDGELADRISCTVGLGLGSQTLGEYLDKWEYTGGKQRNRTFKFPELGMEITFDKHDTRMVINCKEAPEV
ncbi:hypothetical protein AAVH_14713 [Aphelenchoides avenae]|nr:hypothetical protein AAVH_14713 [Aphelenchus avenae]